jgi:heme-degrading monooxygenase HmoA
MADRMVELASKQPGFLGVESVRDGNGLGITVSYWESEEAIRAWKANSDHELAQETGKKLWYADYVIRIAKVERAYGKDYIPNRSAMKCGHDLETDLNQGQF